jgi:hypothetical protein
MGAWPSQQRLEDLQVRWNQVRLNRDDILAVLLIFAGATLAMGQTNAVSPVLITPDEMKWTSQGAYAAPGMEQLNLIGDPAKSGPYTIRLKFPKGYKVAPHTHPDAREVTILSGILQPAMATSSTTAS